MARRRGRGMGGAGRGAPGRAVLAHPHPALLELVVLFFLIFGWSQVSHVLTRDFEDFLGRENGAANADGNGDPVAGP